MQNPKPDADIGLRIVAARQSDLSKLCREFHVLRLELFGSALSDAFDSERSDLDFLVEFQQLQPSDYATAFFAFKEALERLSGGRSIWLSHPPSAIHISGGALTRARHSSMRLEARKYLFDVQEAAELVSQFTAGKDFAHYQQDPMLRLAIERAFTIIGEALSQLARIDASLASRITDFRSIVGFRNILTHAYAQIDDRIVWGIVQSKLPVLIREVDELMNEKDHPESA